MIYNDNIYLNEIRCITFFRRDVFSEKSLVKLCNFSNQLKVDSKLNPNKIISSKISFKRKKWRNTFLDVVFTDNLSLLYHIFFRFYCYKEYNWSSFFSFSFYRERFPLLLHVCRHDLPHVSNFEMIEALKNEQEN